MAHETRTQPDSTWQDGYTVPRSDWESLDAKQFRSINGVRGGAWAPALEQIEINGLMMNGPTVVSGAGVLTCTSTPITLADNDYPELMPGHVGRERDIVQSTLPYMTLAPYTWAVGVNFDYVAAQPLAVTLVDSQGNEASPEFMIPLRVHDGSTLDRVTFTFRVPEQRPSAPQVMPKFRVFRVDGTTGQAEEMKATVLDDGFASPENPGSAAIWYANGAAQTFVYECDQNNVVDISRFAYYAHIVEEGGAAVFPGRVDAFTAHPILAATTISYNIAAANDTTFVDQETILPSGDVPTSLGRPICIFKDQDNPTENGLYKSTEASEPDPDPSQFGKQIVRSPFLSTDRQVANGTLFPVPYGVQNRNTVWQIDIPTPIVVGQSPIRFAPPTPRGNIYHSVTTHFTGIVDTRWQ